MPKIAVNGMELSADDRGEGEAVVFVCGAGQPAEMWEMVGRPSVDAAGFRTVTYDSRGIPPSAVPDPPYAMQDLVDDAIGVIEHFGAGPCHMVGASLGANVVFSVARQRPDLVTSAVLQIGGGPFRPEMSTRFAEMLQGYRQGGESARNVQREVLLDTMLTTASRHDPAAQEAMAPILEMLGNAADDWSGTIGQLTASIEWASRDHLSDATEVTVPTLMMANQDDAFFDPEDLRATADRMSDCTFVPIPGLPHVSLDPDVLEASTRQVIDFISTHRRG